MQHINIEGIKLYGYHGCLEEESKIGTDYTIDVFIRFDFSEAANTDDLSKTIDYCDVYTIVKHEMAIRSKLIEQVCQRIHDKISAEFNDLKWLKVRITKHRPPMNGNVDKVSVELEG